MTLGNKTLRNGVDIAVAARNATARLRLAEVAAPEPQVVEPAPVLEAAIPDPVEPVAQPEAMAAAAAPAPEAAAAPTVEAPPPPVAPPPRGSLVRRIVRRLYRGMKPVARPFVRRLRSYLNQPLAESVARQEATMHQHKLELASHTAALVNALAARSAVLEARSATLEASVAALPARIAEDARANSALDPQQWSLLAQLATSWVTMAPVAQSLPQWLHSVDNTLIEMGARLDRLEQNAQLNTVRIERLQRVEALGEVIATRSERLERIEGLAEMVAVRSERLERIEGYTQAVGGNGDRLDRIESLAAGMVGQIGRLERIEAESHAAAVRTERLEVTLNAQDPQRLQRIESYALHAAQRVAVPGASGETMVRTAVGYVLCAGSDHALIASLLESGELERGTRLLIERLLRPGDTFVDVGANIGMHTLAAARAVQGQGRVVAFEPYEPTARLLAGTVWLNGLANVVEIHQAAVSRAPGTQALHIGATSGHHSLFELQDAGVAARTVDVPVVRLDDALGAGTLVQLLKIDVEGAELDVVEGARELVRANPSAALIVEYGRSHLQRTGRSTADWLQPFGELGLEYKVIDGETGALSPCSERELERLEAVNLLFARADAAAWARAEVPA